MRLSNLAVCCMLLGLLAACSQSANSYSALPQSQSMPAPRVDALRPSALSSPSIVASGTITNVGNNVFTLQTGAPHGLIDVYTNSNTIFNGKRPFVGEYVTVTGTGTWQTYITASTVTQVLSTPTPAPQMFATGTIESVGTNEFSLQTGPPHGLIDVFTTGQTIFNGKKPFVGESVTVVGTGSWQTHIDATEVSQGIFTPSPSPSTSPSYPPNGPNNVTIMRSAPGAFGLAQVFDEYGSNFITAAQSIADGPRYGIIWGARPGNAQNWITNTKTLIPGYYMPQETDAAYNGWGNAGHDLSWWTTNHPDWILYACEPDGTPTTTPAYLGQLPDNIPLDIHNPDVTLYQMRTAGGYAYANDYKGLTFDQVVFSNPTGSGVGSGYFGCGIYENGKFVRRYTSAKDPAWETDTIAWVKAAYWDLSNDPVIGPAHLKLILNHPANNISDPNEQAILQNSDADIDEVGYSDYGNWHASSSLFKLTTDWMRFAQAAGSAPVVIDKFSQTQPLSNDQIEYSIGTYMMGNEGGSGIFAGNSNSYGAEQYLAQYQTKMGAPCGDYYGGPTFDPNNPAIWYRNYGSALVVVNGGSPTSETAHLPTNHTYVDLMGRTVTNPLTVASGDAWVLLTPTNGCH